MINLKILSTAAAIALVAPMVLPSESFAQKESKVGGMRGGGGGGGPMAGGGGRGFAGGGGAGAIRSGGGGGGFSGGGRGPRHCRSGGASQSEMQRRDRRRAWPEI